MPKQLTRYLLFLALAAALLLLLTACEREERRFHEPPAGAAALNSIRLSDLRPGVSPPPPGTAPSYDENAYAISEGRRLFNWYNGFAAELQFRSRAG
jgi:cytochrome c oxidase cbb3-type subunit 3